MPRQRVLWDLERDLIVLGLSILSEARALLEVKGSLYLIEPIGVVS